MPPQMIGSFHCCGVATARKCLFTTGSHHCIVYP